MTVTAGRPTEVATTKDPRELVSADLFGKLVERVQEEMPVATFYAERMVEQMLVYLKAVADNATNPDAQRLTPSAAVDPAWHAFVVHTQEYRAFCREVTGHSRGFIEHVPIINEDIRSGKSLTRTLDAMRATGYPVDDQMWEQWTSCGSTDKCWARVSFDE